MSNNEGARRKIKNENYLKFLEQGEINILDKIHIEMALDNINRYQKKHKKEAKALVIIMYLTGARPVEILRLKGKMVKENQKSLVINMPASKRGLPRLIYLELKDPLVLQFWDYANKFMPELYLFPHFIGNHIKRYKNKKGEEKSYQEVSGKLRYYFNIWFSDILGNGINPYYLRHNRLSKLAINGVDLQALRMFKGAKTFDSIMPYLHMSSDVAKKISKKID